MMVCIGKNEELGIMVFVDYIVVFFYFAVLIVVGVWYCKRAVKNLESYFLGGKRFIGRLWQCLGRFPLSISQAQCGIIGNNSRQRPFASDKREILTIN